MVLWYGYDMLQVIKRVAANCTHDNTLTHRFFDGFHGLAFLSRQSSSMLCRPASDIPQVSLS